LQHGKTVDSGHPALIISSKSALHKWSISYSETSANLAKKKKDK